MERVIDCPVCLDTDNCFEDVQDTYNSYLCFKCGFMSDSRYTTDSLELADNLKKSPQLVIDKQFHDKVRNIIWFPAVINMGIRGIIYPEGKDNFFQWKYAKVIEIPESEQHKFNGHKQRLDVEGALSFSQDDFLGACKAMGITERLDNG